MAAISDTATVALKLTRAIELGRRLAAIRRELDAWRLSRSAWTARTLELAGWRDEASLEAVKARLLELPNLWHEMAIRARLWVDHGQDVPAIWQLDGDRFPTAYVEFLHSGVTVAQMSAVICSLVREARDQVEGFAWGKADDIGPDGDAARAMKPYLAELAQLDKQLAGTLLASMLSYRPGGAEIVHESFPVVVDDHSVRHLATAFAEAAQLRAEPVPEPA